MSRYSRDLAVVGRYLPSSTGHANIDGTDYWTFSITCELGNMYVMTAYFDGREYQVRVLEPEIPSHYDIHTGHIFSDGRICLNPPANGAETLQEAFAKAVIWASGFSALEHTGEFPF